MCWAIRRMWPTSIPFQCIFSYPSDEEQASFMTHLVLLRPRTLMVGRMLLAALALLVPMSLLGARWLAPTAPVERPDLSRLALPFVPNQGQSDSRVRFQAHGMGGSLFFTPEEIVLALPTPADGGWLESPSSILHPQSSAEPSVIRLRFDDANATPKLSAAQPLPGVFNYLLGNDSSQWRTGLPTYGELVYEQLYPGISVRYEGTDGSLKSTYDVAPGVDPRIIRWRYEGASGARLDEAGSLLLTIPAGDAAPARTLTEHAPIAWQEISGRRVPVAARYLLFANGGIGFEVGAYDPSQPLTIDPKLEYSTYLGGSGADAAYAVAVDGAGLTYVTGTTQSTTFPGSPGTVPGSSLVRSDVFVVKVLPDGTGTAFRTLIGGSGDDTGRGIAIGPGGGSGPDVYITGSTRSSDFPTSTPLAGTGAGTGADVFVAKLDETGSALLFGTYLSTGGDDESNGIAVEGTNIYIAGSTEANGLRPSGGTGQGNWAGGFDAFVARLNGSGSAYTLGYLSYMGGNGNDAARGVAVAAGAAYVTGYAAAGFPTTPGALQATNGGGRDAFVAKMNAAGAASYSTFLGGTNGDEGNSIAVQPTGEAYITGATGSSGAGGFPTTPGALQTANGGGIDAFVTKLNPAGSALIYSTYLGGALTDQGNSIAVDAASRAVIAGSTSSANFPKPPLVAQPLYGGADAFVTKLNPSGGGPLVASFYLGGSSDDAAYGVAMLNDVYHVAGSTYSTDFTTVPAGVLQPSNGGGASGGLDAFITKVSDPALSISDVAIDEGNAGTTNAVFDVALSGPSFQDVTVQYSTADGTATAGSDYVAITPQTLIIPAGQITRTITVTINGDTTYEDDETFLVNLSAAGNATIADGQGLGTIRNDDAPPTVAFSSATYSVGEGASSATITVNLSAASGRAVMVDYATSNGTATQPTDYTATSGTLTFNPGQQTKTFSVAVADDTLNEADETVNLTLSNATNATLGTPNPATLTILDDDAAPTVAFSAATYSVNENVGGGTATITLTLNAVSGQTVTVDYGTGDGTATQPADYTTASGTLTFNPGEQTKTFTIPLANDTLDEANETVNLALSNPGNATLGSPIVAILTILDDDPTPTVAFSSASYSVNEGVGTGTISVELSAASGRTVTVDYATSDGTATQPADYTTATGTLTFNPGEQSKTFSIPLNNDALDEANESINLALSNASNATLGTPGSAVLNILDDDAAPTVAFSAATTTVAESAGSTTITVTLSSASGQNVTVPLTLAGTATSPSDYTLAPTTITIPAGSTSGTATLTINNDTLDEADETVDLGFSALVGATAGSPATQTVTITDDDAAPTVAFSAATYSANEGAGNATITANLSAPSGQTVTVDYATSDGSATQPGDYTTATGTLTFNPGEQTKTFAFPLTNDTTYELDETLDLALSNATNVMLGTPATATLTILDDDGPVVTFSAATYSTNEIPGTATITVNLSKPVIAGETVTVNYSTSNGTATAGSDYTSASGTLTFNPGEDTKTFTVTVAGDAAYEADETVNLALSITAGDNATLGAPGSATLTILDDDGPTVALTAATYSVAENAGNAGITVSLSAPVVAGRTVTIIYNTSDGTATQPSDYTGVTTGTLTFNPGEQTKTLPVPIINDTTDEVNETLGVTISVPGGSNVTLGTPASATVTIIDNDGPTITVAGVAVTEGHSGTVNAVFSVGLSAASPQPVTVNYATANGTATQPADYATASGTLTFPANSAASQTITIVVKGDKLDEANETFAINLSNAVNGTPSASSIQGTITDDDTSPVATADSYTLNEDQALTVAVGSGLLANDSEADGDPFTAVLATGVSTGTLTLNANGSFTYTPPANYNGVISFTYRARDASGNQSAATTVQITVNPVNDPPTAVNDRLNVTKNSTTNNLNVLANDSMAPDAGEQLTITAVTAASHGNVAVVFGGAGLTYTPQPGYLGPDTFSYTISDGNGGTATATVFLTVGDFKIYLPLLFGPPPVPDLAGSFTLDRSTLEPEKPVKITVTVTNRGEAPASQFWVDFYINPSQPPSGPNQRWDSVCGLKPCYGIAWYVDQTLAPGQSITLTSTADSYAASYTRWPGAFAPGTRDLYLYVDSWNPGVAHGAVLEKDETNNHFEFHGTLLNAADGLPSTGDSAPFDPWFPAATPVRPARLEE